MRRTPFVLSIIGRSDSGKTTLILKLLPELKQKGFKVAVAKHCPHGFDLDIEGKDSCRFTKAGSEGTFLSSETEIALMKPKDSAGDIRSDLQNYFSGFDMVLMEGYNQEPGGWKIQIVRDGIGGFGDFPGDIIAYITNTKLDTDKPVYHIDDVTGIVSFIESMQPSLRTPTKRSLHRHCEERSDEAI